jgi:uncharacterized protein (TIGR02300 family)
MTDRGLKHVCPACGVVFYDLGKENAVCPNCGKSLDGSLEIEFIKRKKKAEVKVAVEKDMPDFESSENSDDEGEIFLDDADTDIGRGGEDE